MPPILTWLTQLLLIIVAAQIAGRLAQLVRQPRVVGEMAAGIVLGPSLLGRAAPELFERVLGAPLLGGIHALSQLGLLLFMFLIGLELQPALLWRKGRAAVAISLSSIAVPLVSGMLLGLALAPWIGGPGVPVLHFALFLGTALSITAFPVLARILAERGLLHTPLGALAIACAAADDLLAWCLLAGVVLLIHTTVASLPIWLMLAGSACYAAAMLTGGRWLAARLLATARSEPLTHAQQAGMLVAMLGSAAITEWLGIHALFGAFLAGAIMPRDAGLLRQVRGKLEDLTSIVLLPLFFASIGLRTNIGLIDGGVLWAAGALILSVAIISKLGGATLAARLSHMPWRESLAIGVLMNTRGLMELVVASIGLEIGVITPAIFSILVLTAIVTTCLTGPLLDLLGVVAPQPERREPSPDLAGETT
jgi:Kef-type K+ transport system membrane component KefB